MKLTLLMLLARQVVSSLMMAGGEMILTVLIEGKLSDGG